MSEKAIQQGIENAFSWSAEHNQARRCCLAMALAGALATKLAMPRDEGVRT